MVAVERCHGRHGRPYKRLLVRADRTFDGTSSRDIPVPDGNNQPVTFLGQTRRHPLARPPGSLIAAIIVGLLLFPYGSSGLSATFREIQVLTSQGAVGTFRIGECHWGRQGKGGSEQLCTGEFQRAGSREQVAASWAVGLNPARYYQAGETIAARYDGARNVYLDSGDTLNNAYEAFLFCLAATAAGLLFVVVGLLRLLIWLNRRRPRT
ncbi:hypothetical protein [Fodinicola feengrottensis]|uniref:hypothetical protein n=1 Tax=Fodinicola feengrottensis TaxID=435914 RepID=UPI0031CF944C